MATEEQEKDQQDKLELTIEKLGSFCSVDSEHEDIRKIAKALKAGDDKLTGKIISNGATNYAYKIFLDGDPSTAVFAKVGFSRALWHPDPTAKYDLNRLNCESEIMTKFKGIMGDSGKPTPVATPYCVFDLTDEIRVMVAQFVPADEEWANQFLDGQVDRRIISGVAEAFALLNISEVDPQFNAGMKDAFRGMHVLFRGILMQIVSAEDDPPDQAHMYAKELGQEKLTQVMDGMDAEYEKLEVLLHGDSHVFNVLVEPRPDTASFGEKGCLYICDWEMTHCGSRGRDVGVFLSWPILSAYFLAAEGKKEAANDLIACTNEFWDVYHGILVEKSGKDEEYMKDTFRVTLGWAGYYLLFAWYLLKLPQGRAPVDKLSPEHGAKAFGSVGLTGLKFVTIAFSNEQPNLTLGELREWYKTRLNEEIETLLALLKE